MPSSLKSFRAEAASEDGLEGQKLGENTARAASGAKIDSDSGKDLDGRAYVSLAYEE